MRNIIILSLEELRQLEKGYVVSCRCGGVKTQIVCADNVKDAITMIDMEKEAENDKRN